MMGSDKLPVHINKCINQYPDKIQTCKSIHMKYIQLHMFYTIWSLVIGIMFLGVYHTLCARVRFMERTHKSGIMLFMRKHVWKSTQKHIRMYIFWYVEGCGVDGINTYISKPGMCSDELPKQKYMCINYNPYKNYVSHN